MEKIIHGLWRAPDADPAAVAEILLGDVAPSLLDLGVRGLRVLVEEPEAAAMRSLNCCCRWLPSSLFRSSTLFSRNSLASITSPSESR